MTGALMRSRTSGHGHTHRGERHVKTKTQRADSYGKMEAELVLCCYKSRNAWDPQRLEKSRKDPPLEPSKRVQPCQHLDFELLASISVRE